MVSTHATRVDLSDPAGNSGQGRVVRLLVIGDHISRPAESRAGKSEDRTHTCCGELRWHETFRGSKLVLVRGEREHPMTDTVPALTVAVCSSAALMRRFEAIVFDWDGMAALDRDADVGRLRELVEAASAHGVELAIVSEADVGTVDGELLARPAGPGGLIVALNHGSQVFSVDQHGPRLEFRRTATPEEDATLSRAARLTVERLEARGLDARIVGELNRREISLMPEFDGEGANKAASAELLAVVERRLAAAGIGGLPGAIALASEAAAEVGSAGLRVTSNVKHVKLGLTDKSDSGRWIMQWLWRRGIAPGQVLIAAGELGPLEGLAGGDWLLCCDDRGDRSGLSAGVGPGGFPDCAVLVSGGPEAFFAVLEDQIARRGRGELPIVVEDPRWALVIEDSDPVLARVQESLLTLADGRLGTRGSTLSRQVGRWPSVMMSGVYARAGSETHLLAAPRWNEVFADGSVGRAVRRVLDLHAGVLHQRLGDGSGRCEALLFSSLKRPGTPALRARGPIQMVCVARSLEPPPAVRCEQGEDDGLVWMRGSGQPASIAAAAHGHLRASDSEAVLDRVAAYEGAPHGMADHRRALERVRCAREDGFDALLAEHRRAWASRWEDADVAIEGDCELQQAVRFALFHLIASVADDGEAAVGARGLSGSAYRGHVFWDSDVYVLPFLAATHPRAARAMLEYRIRRLPAALRAARAEGRQGARFPWESARSGQDVTPDRVRRRGGSIPVLTGELEEHIVADVAWAAACYIDWTGDQAFASGPGRELLVQTARWWASRIEPDEHGRGHVRGVIGPDEYHERVDDNAYTNVMARWNLRRAAKAGGQAVDQSERRRWLDLAQAIVDGYDPCSGIYEQFAGFHQLEALLIAKLAPQRPVAADMLLGHGRVRGAQVVKQADVLMLHYLVPDEVAAGSLEPNLDFYDPRTAHGSTLSPGVHAALLARAGRIEQAIQALRLTARIDLDDIGHMTAGGLHTAAMGSVWRALTYGFTGLRPVGDQLAIDPVLPPGWQTLDVRVQFRGSRVRCRIRAGEAELTADPPLTAVNPAGERVRLTARPRILELAARSERRA